MKLFLSDSCFRKVCISTITIIDFDHDNDVNQLVSISVANYESVTEVGEYIGD